MNGVAILIIFILMFVAAMGLGIFLGFRRNGVQIGVRIGMVLVSIVASVILTINLSPIMFTETISLFESFLGAESLTYLLSGTEGANGVLSFVQAMVAPVSFALFFLGFTLVFALIYKALSYFFISNEKIAAFKKRKEEKEGEKNPSDSTEAEAAPNADDESVGTGADSAKGEAAYAAKADGWSYYDGADKGEASPSDASDVEISEPQENKGEDDEELNEEDGENENKSEEKDGDKKGKKGKKRGVGRGVLVCANTVCALITAVAFSVPATSFIGAGASVIEGVGGEEAANKYVDTVNSDGDTTGAKEFISEITFSSQTPFYYMYSALGAPITYSITEVSVGDTASQPLNKAIASSGTLITSVLELIANADLLSAKATWLDYAETLYKSSDTIAATPYWDRLLGSIFSDAAQKWKEDKEFIGIESPFKFGYSALEKDIYIILSENNEASVELNALGDALCVLYATACAGDSTSDAALAMEMLMKNTTDESSAIVIDFVTDELISDLGLTEKESEVYKKLITALLSGALEVSKTAYADEAERSQAIETEAGYVESFLKFFNDPDLVENSDFISSCVHSAMVQSTIKNLTGDGAINDPSGIAGSISFKRFTELLTALLKEMKAYPDKAEEYLSIIAYITQK